MGTYGLLENNLEKRILEQRVLEYIDEFMEKRGFSHCATWRWLKIAANGEPVVPFGNAHKLPSEKLLFFSRRESLVPELCNTTFATIPSRVHSQKPAIHAFLEKLAPKGRFLEIFARRLVPNWTVLGNEVLYLNDCDFYELQK